MNFWHMQLHPNDKDSWSKEDILHMVKDVGVVGLAESWEHDHGQPAAFKNTAAIGDFDFFKLLYPKFVNI